MPDNQLTTPVVLLIYNRPQETRLVFDAIAAARPRHLLVIADGPRSVQDELKCAEARSIVDTVNWDCRVDRHYADQNLGVRERPASGLHWAFSLVEEAIILEDDCVPAPEFFKFCATLLERYRADERVMQIGGANFQRGQRRSQHGYYFSIYYHVWGWATWRRAWQHYDVGVTRWPELKRARLLESLPMTRAARAHWSRIFDRAWRGELNTWDFQWQLAMWSQYGLAAVADGNLISNVGFGPSASHTYTPTWHAEMPIQKVHLNGDPQTMVADRAADEAEFKDRHLHQTPLLRRMISRARRYAK